MIKYVFVSDNGDDKNDGLEENRPVRSAANAIKISLKTGREIRMLDNWEAIAGTARISRWNAKPPDRQEKSDGRCRLPGQSISRAIFWYPPGSPREASVVERGAPTARVGTPDFG